MKISLFDDDKRKHLLPLVFTKPCASLRVGILTIEEKWNQHLRSTSSFETVEYLSAKYPTSSDFDLKINGRLLPNKNLVNHILNHFDSGVLKDEDGNTLVAHSKPGENHLYTESCSWINRPYDLFSLNGQEIEADFQIITNEKSSQELPSNVMVSGDHPIFIEEGATLNFCSLNSSNGPIYIGKNAEIMEGSLVRGPFALCESATLKLGTKIYGATTIGPHSKVGGEVNNSVIQGYSNKGHDGFLGNSVIGEWCNLGADTNNSNLKNNYDEVKLWNYSSGRFEKSGLQFCGLIMGDHSKCGINTMFNTGTVVGVSANIFGSGFPRNFIPSFSWGGNSGFATYTINKALTTSKIVMGRRNIELDQNESEILTNIYNNTAEYRSWEN